MDTERQSSIVAKSFVDEFDKLAADWTVGAEGGPAMPASAEAWKTKLTSSLKNARGAIGNLSMAGKIGAGAAGVAGLAALVKALGFGAKKSLGQKAIQFAKAHPYGTAAAAGGTAALAAAGMSKSSSLEKEAGVKEILQGLGLVGKKQGLVERNMYAGGGSHTAESVHDLLQALGAPLSKGTRTISTIGGSLGGRWYGAKKHATREAARVLKNRLIAAGIPAAGLGMAGAYEMGKQSNLSEAAQVAFNDEMQKISGLVSESLGTTMNPLNVVGNPIAALLALGNPTRGTAEQAEADKAMVSNYLVPGKGFYNMLKRQGFLNKKVMELAQKHKHE